MKNPEPVDPAKELAKALAGRLWKAHSAWLERHRQPLPQARIAAEVGERAGVPVDQTTVGTWFRETPPKPWFLKPLADFYEVDLLWFIANIGQMRPEPSIEEEPIIPMGKRGKKLPPVTPTASPRRRKA